MLNAGSEPEMQLSMDKLSSACDNFGLTISTKKTKVMHQPAPNRPYQEPFICVKGQKLQPVDKFMYLGSTLSRAVLIDDAINSRIATKKKPVQALAGCEQLSGIAEESAWELSCKSTR